MDKFLLLRLNWTPTWDGHVLVETDLEPDLGWTIKSLLLRLNWNPTWHGQVCPPETEFELNLTDRLRLNWTQIRRLRSLLLCL